MRRRILQYSLMIVTTLLAVVTWPATAWAAPYGQGSFGLCNYSAGCGASGGLLPNVGSRILFFCSIGALIIAAAIVIYFFVRRRRKRQQTTLNIQPPQKPGE